MEKENNNQLTSSRKVVIRDTNALLQTAPISRIKTLRDDEGRSKNVGQALPDNRKNLIACRSDVSPTNQRGNFYHNVGFTPDLHISLMGKAPSPARGEERRGFTLIELLVVVLIIGILAAAALPQYQKAVEKSRATEAFMLMNSLMQSLDRYVLEHGYPEDVLYFLGDDAPCHDCLDIELGSLNCDTGDDYVCDGKVFYYSASCSSIPTSCTVVAVRQNVNYSFHISKNKDGHLSKECMYPNNTGKQVCDSLVTSGWTSTKV